MGSVRRRHGDTDARWEARYRDAGGRQRTKGGFSRKNDALRWLARVEADVQRGEFLDPQRGRVSFAEVAERWIDSQRGSLKPKGWQGYRGILDRYLLPHFGRRRVSHIDHAAVQEFVDDLRDRYAPGTVRKVYAVLRLVMGSAIAHGHIKANPCSRAVTLPRLEGRTPTFLTDDQVHVLAAAVKPLYGTLIRFAAYTGLRAGEIGALRVRDLNLPTGPVRVTRSLADVGGRLVEGDTKTGRNRTVPLGAELREELAAHLARLYPTGPAPDKLVFPGDQGGPLRHQNFYRRHFKPAVRAVLPPELHELRFHDLRHTCAALLIDEDAHPKEIAEWLGHSTINVTMDTYGHIFPNRSEALAERLDARLRTTRTTEER